MRIRDWLRDKGKNWWVAIAGWVFATVFAMVWLVDLVPYSTVWGDVGTWIAAVSTFGGLMYAGLGLRHQVAQRESEETRRQVEEEETRLANARKVAVSSRVQHYEILDHPYSDFTLENVWRVEFTVVNSSPYPVDTVVVRVPQFGESDGFNGRYEEIVEGTLLPGAQVSSFGLSTSKTPPVFGEMVDICRVDFTDTWGSHWHRGPQTLEPRALPPRVC